MTSREQLQESQSIRESYTRFPFQGFWTWLTGKELSNRESARQISPIECAVWSVIQLVSGIAASVAIMTWHFNAVWILLSVTLTVSGARYIVATIIHHGVHNAIFRSELANRILCEVLSTITIVQPFDSYRRFHVHEHHGREFSTMDDQDLAAIYTLGLRPGTTVRRMKWVLAWQCISPLFHVRYLYGRLKSNYHRVPFYRAAMSSAWLLTLTVVGFALPMSTFLIAFVIPLTVVYQICSLLHLVTEHAWVLRADAQTVRESHVKNSHGRFCGRKLPPPELAGVAWVSAWLGWWLEHLLLHLPARLLIVQGSLVVHDWHHRTGSDRNWPHAVQRREAEVQKELAQGIYSYTDIWGINNVISDVMRRISDAPAPPSLSRLKYRLN